MAAPTLSKTVLAVALSAGVLALPGPSQAQQPLSEYSCEELWIARNEIYAMKGYCFKSAKAKARFGAGCFAPFGKLSKSEANTISEIKKEERRQDCPV